MYKALLKQSAEMIQFNQLSDFSLNFFEADLVLEILHINEDLNESLLPLNETNNKLDQ